MRFRGVVAGLSAVAVLAAGCGDGSDDATDEVSTVTLDLLDTTVEGGTVRVEMTVDDVPWAPSSGGAGTQASAELTGVVDLEAGESDLTSTLDVEPIAPDGGVDPVLAQGPTTFQIREVDGRTFVRQWSEGAGDDTPWIEDTDADLDDDGEGDDGVDVETHADDDSLLGKLFDPTGFDPEGALEALREVTDVVTEEGRDEVRGEPTTRYRAVVDGDDVGEDVDIEGEEPLDVWIDDEGRLRRVEVATLRLDLFDYGVPVEIDVPTDIGSSDDSDAWFGMTQPKLVGEWTVEATGTTPAGTGWTVFAAPHELDGVPFTCRTLELDGDGPLDRISEAFGDSGVWGMIPNHDGVAATCGYSSWFGTPTTNDPSVQILQPGITAAADPTDGLIAFAVDDRWRGGPVRLVRDGADDVELSVDPSGLATWVPEGPSLTEVWLGGDAVRCDVSGVSDMAHEDEGEGDDDAEGVADELIPDELTWLAPMIIGACVRP